MKNKKGFTLVELLAVIAILAILMLLVTPNILSLFRQGQKEGYALQIQAIINAVPKQMMADSNNDLPLVPYCSVNGVAGEGTRKINVTESKDIDYYVSFDDDGNITKVLVSGKDFHYSAEKEGDNYPTANVDEEDLQTGKAVISCASGGSLTVSE